MKVHRFPRTGRIAIPAAAVLAMLSCADVTRTLAQAPAIPPGATSGDAKEFDAAEALFNKQSWADAAGAFEKFLEKYKTFSPRSLDAKFRLAVAYLQLERYDDAVKQLRELLANPKVEPAAREMAQLLIAKGFTLKGFKMPSDTDPQKAAQKKVFADAVKEYDAFLTTFPKSADLDSAHFLRATLLLQSDNFDEALKGFGTVVRIPNSPFAWEALMWVGKTFFLQANALLDTKGGREPSADDIKAALAIFDKATPSLTEAYQKSGDVALMNEAVFFVGQMQLTRSQNAGPGEDPGVKQQQTALLEQALEAFRAVRSVEEVVAAQEAKIADLEKAKTLLKPGTPDYLPRKNRIETLIDHEGEKREKFKTGQDQYLSARIAIARIFLFLKKTDEARALIKYLLALPGVFDNDKESLATVSALLCLTYAEQKNVEKALETYKEFRKDFKSNPSGDNLPLLVANTLVDADRGDEAEKIVAEGMADYKDWRFTTEATQILTATALKRGDYKKALELCERLLTGNPKADVEAQTLLIKGSVQQAQALLTSNPKLADEAYETFKKVRDKYPNTPQAEDAWFNMGQILVGRDPQKAVEELKGWVEKYGAGGALSNNTAKNIPTAQYLIGSAYDRANEKGKAIAAWQEVIEKYPESEPAPGAFFKLFDFYNEKKEFVGARKLMEEFVQKYPRHENVYFAYNNIAEFLFTGAIEDAGATKAGGYTIANTEAGTKKLLEYVDYETANNISPKHGDAALLKVADRWLRELAKLPPYLTLNESQRATWQKAVDGTVGAIERLLKDYPTSDRLAEGLERLVTAENTRRKAQQTDTAKIEAYFNDLTKNHGADPLTKAKIQMALASFLVDTDPARAFKVMDDAFKAAPASTKPKQGSGGVVPTFIPADYDRYLAGLFDAKRVDDIAKIVARMRAEFPMAADADPNAAPGAVREGQAVALFWDAKLLQEQGKITEAGTKFAELKQKFPRSSKALEADYGVILGEFERSNEVKPDYIQRLSKVVNTQTGKSFELQAKALYLIGRIQEAKKDIDGAIETYEKIQVRYASVPRVAIEGLWKAAELSEKQARGESGYPVKTVGEKRAAAEARAKELKAAKDAAKPEQPKPAEPESGTEKPAEPKSTTGGVPQK